MRRRGTAIVLTAVLLMAAAVALTTAGAQAAQSAPAVTAPHPSKTCGSSGGLRVKARAVSCRFARRWVGRYLRNGSRPSGWSCVRTSGRAPFYCTRGSVRAYWAERR